MERLPIYRGTECIGTLEAAADGLYWRVSAVCTGQPLERLWLHTAGHRYCLGPLEPENGLLVCRGRVSRAALGGEAITHAVAAAVGGRWEERGSMTLYGSTHSDVLCSEDRAAVPYRLDAPFPFPGQFCLCRIETIGSGWYVTVPLER